MAPRPLPAYGDGVASGRSRRWCGCGPGSPRATPRSSPPTSCALRWPTCARPGRARWIEPRLAALLGLGERTAADRRTFRGLARSSSIARPRRRGARLRGPAARRRRLLDFIDHLLECARPAVRGHVRPSGPRRARRRFGAESVRPRCTSSRWGTPRWPLVEGLVGPARRGPRRHRPRGGHPAVRRRDGAHAARPGRGGPRGRHVLAEGEPDALAVPATLQALIAARLDGLARRRRVLRDAACSA